MAAPKSTRHAQLTCRFRTGITTAGDATASWSEACRGGQVMSIVWIAASISVGPLAGRPMERWMHRCLPITAAAVLLISVNNFCR